MSFFIDKYTLHIMKREEILEESRRENKNRDLAEIELQTKAVKLAYILCIALDKKFEELFYFRQFYKRTVFVIIFIRS